MEIMYHVSYWFSPPSHSLRVCLVTIPSPPLLYSPLSHICILRIRRVCVIAVAAAIECVEEVLNQNEFPTVFTGLERLSGCLRVLHARHYRASL